MPGPVARTQPKPEHRPQQEGNLMPEVSRQFEDAPVDDLVEPQPQASTQPLPEEETRPSPGVSKHINTGVGSTVQPGS
jgi:hypothetical protein